MARSAAEDEDAAVLALGDDFGDAGTTSCLWNSEVKTLLEAEAARVAQDPSEVASDMVHTTLRYVKRFSNYRTAEAVAQAKAVFHEHAYEPVTEFEIAALNNLNVLTVDEAKSLVPSLAGLRARVLEHRGLEATAAVHTDAILEELLSDLRRFQHQ